MRAKAIRHIALGIGMGLAFWGGNATVKYIHRTEYKLRLQQQLLVAYESQAPKHEIDYHKHALASGEERLPVPARPYVNVSMLGVALMLVLIGAGARRD